MVFNSALDKNSVHSHESSAISENEKVCFSWVINLIFFLGPELLRHIVQFPFFSNILVPGHIREKGVNQDHLMD